MDREFDGRSVLITGGTGFLGSAIVKRFLDGGAVVHVTWVADEELKRFAYTDKVQLHQLNASDEKAVADLYVKIPDLWASIHTIGGFAINPIDQTSADEFRRMFELNAVTCFLCCREAVKTMRRVRQAHRGQGGDAGAGGRIVNVAARPAIAATGGMIAYTTSKAAVASITQSLAEELKNDRVLVNAVLPSIMDTPANRRSMPQADFDKWPKVEQVAETIAFLASPRNTLTSGALVPVFGRS